MKVTNKFLLSLRIPPYAWRYEVINYVGFYTLRNSIYCQIFWLQLWYNDMAIRFQQQNMIRAVDNLDLTLPVFIDENLTLHMAEPIVQSIDYYYTNATNNSTQFKLPVNMLTVLILFILATVITIISNILFVPKESQIVI